MNGPRRSYLRTHRKRRGLSQREVGFLVGLDSGQVVSRYETHALVPKLNTTFAYQILFGELPHRLFPDHYGEVEASLAVRLMQLIEVLGEQEPRPIVLQKREALQNVLQRIERGNSDL